jgi:hypothetical protein
MLGIASRTLFGALISSHTWVTKLWADDLDEGSTGSSQCGAVQKSVQLSVGDYSTNNYTGIKDYLETVKLRVDHGLDAHLIDRKCAECITNQFVSAVPVEQQSACGPVVTPTAACGFLSQKQVHAASILSFSAAPNAWGDGNQWTLWVNLTQQILGCQFISETNAPSTASATVVAAAASTGSATCAQPGVFYCGPGNSTNPTFPGTGILFPPVSPCMNNACCNHDNCYAKECAPGVCYFTPQNADCDAPLLSACLGQGGCSTLKSCNPFNPLCEISTIAVCAVVVCAEVPLSPLCAAIQSARLSISPQCETPCNGSCCGTASECLTSSTSVPGAIAGTCCPSAQVCGTTCCTSTQTCSNGTCATTCSSGETPCGNVCCPKEQYCSNGVCVTNSNCPGEMPCGQACCPSTWECCAPGVCAETPAGQICCYEDGVVVVCGVGASGRPAVCCPNCSCNT